MHANIHYEMSISDYHRTCQHHQDGILKLPLEIFPVKVNEPQLFGLLYMHVELTVVRILFMMRKCNGDAFPLKNVIHISSGVCIYDNHKHGLLIQTGTNLLECLTGLPGRSFPL